MGTNSCALQHGCATGNGLWLVLDVPYHRHCEPSELSRPGLGQCFYQARVGWMLGLVSWVRHTHHDNIKSETTIKVIAKLAR